MVAILIRGAFLSVVSVGICIHPLWFHPPGSYSWSWWQAYLFHFVLEHLAVVMTIQYWGSRKPTLSRGSLSHTSKEGNSPLKPSWVPQPPYLFLHVCVHGMNPDTAVISLLVEAVFASILFPISRN